MTINLKELVHYVDSQLTKEGYVSKGNVMIIVPIIYHIRNDDKIVICDQDDIEVSFDNKQITFTVEYNNGTYTIYDDFYDFKGDKSNMEDMHNYLRTLTQDHFNNNGSWVAIYYRVQG